MYIHGQVQGVNFRNEAKIEAEILGLAGFVENKENGTVYAEAEGEESALKKFAQWCKEGPAYAAVEKVDIKEGEVVGYKEFKIKL